MGHFALVTVLKGGQVCLLVLVAGQEEPGAVDASQLTIWRGWGVGIFLGLSQSAPGTGTSLPALVFGSSPALGFKVPHSAAPCTSFSKRWAGFPSVREFVGVAAAATEATVLVRCGRG